MLKEDCEGRAPVAPQHENAVDEAQPNQMVEGCEENEAAFVVQGKP